MNDDNQLPLETPVSGPTISRAGQPPVHATPMMPPRLPQQPRGPKAPREISLGVLVLGVVFVALLSFCGFVLVKMGSPASQSEVQVDL